MSARVRTVTRIGAVAAIAMAAAGCGGGSAGDQPADGTIAVVASTNVWGSVVRAVGGDAVSVTSIIDDPSADPHAYESEPADATAIAGASLAVYNGGGYDEFFTKLLDSEGQDLPRVEAFELSGASEGEEEHAGDGEHADEHGHEHGAVNEHVWYDLPTVATVAEKIAEELGKIDPRQRDTFTANAEAFHGETDTLADTVAKIGERYPDGKVVATEPVAHYLIEAAGLTDVTPEEFSEAIEEETDPSPAAVAETNDLVTGGEILMLVNNAQTRTPVTDSLVEKANSSGVVVVEVTETLPENVTSYVEWMKSQVDAMAAATPAT